jgi:hypothetical protein
MGDQLGPVATVRAMSGVVACSIVIAERAAGVDRTDLASGRDAPEARGLISIHEDSWPQTRGSSELRAVVSIEALMPTASAGTPTRSSVLNAAIPPGTTWSVRSHRRKHTGASPEIEAGEQMSEAAVPTTDSNGDEVLVRLTVERLTIQVGHPADVVEATVRDELHQRRASARIQTFVPILAERAARLRLRNHVPD